MLDSEELEEYLSQIRETPYNSKYEGIDAFGGAVEIIKGAINSPDVEDVYQVMDEAVKVAMDYITSDRHPNEEGYIARDRYSRPIFIDDLEVAILTKYMPRRLSNFLKGFQAEFLVANILYTIKGVRVVKDGELDLLIKTKFSIDGVFSADKNHHIDIAIQHKHKLYLIHVFQEKSREAVKKKIARYMSRKNIIHILDYRYAITYGSLTDLTPDYVAHQVVKIFEGDRTIKIKPDGTVQFNDFD